jgi:Tfp pilus assembly protein PilF
MPGADQPPFNPLPAEKDVDVATFYMKKGDPDAAIPRLEEAIKLNPNYAKPRLMLGEIYEKKKDNDKAVKYYQDYLKVLPHAPDAKKIQEKIAKLQSP